MDKSYLWKRHNIYWVRVRVPDKVRSIIGKSELSRNLYTSDLSKANNIKHSVIAEFKQEISRAEKKIDKSIDQLSKEDRLKEFALEFRSQSNKSSQDRDSAFDDVIQKKVLELYGQRETEAIFNSHHHDWNGQDASEKALKATLDSYRIADPSSQPIKLVSQEFLTEKKRDLQNSTYKRKEGNISNFISWLGDTDVGNIHKRIAGKYVSHLIQTKNPASNTLSNITSDIGSLFRWAEARGYIDQNPFYNLQLPKSKKNVQGRRPWSNEEIIRFLHYDKIELNDFGASAIALYSGMRLGEICGLKKSDISEDCFHIHKGKTSAASRVVPINSVLKTVIKKLFEKSKDGYLITDISPGGDDNKRSWNFQKRLGRIRKDIKLPKGVVFHSLRNTFTTRMENLGIPRNHISQILGHEDGNMALDVYSGGLAIEPLRESINKLTYGSGMDLLIKKLVICLKNT